MKKLLSFAGVILSLVLLLSARSPAEEAHDFLIYTDAGGETYDLFEIQKFLYDEEGRVRAVLGRFERVVEDEEDGHGERTDETFTFRLSPDFHADMLESMTGDTLDNVPVTDLQAWYIRAYLDGEPPEGGEMAFSCDFTEEQLMETAVDFWFVTTRIELNDQSEITYMEYVFVPWA